MALYLHFECGRRGVNDPECRWCGRLIHKVDGRWLDGAARVENDIPGRGALETHIHEPAREIGPSLGPFAENYVQLTYDAIRYEGAMVAYYDEPRGDWLIVEPWTGAGEAYSDVIIQAREG